MEKLVKRWENNPELQVPKTPLSVSGIVLTLLQDYFFTQKRFIKGNPLQSNLIVDLYQQWKPEDCENYPGVYVKRGPARMRVESKTIGDYAGFFTDNPGGNSFWIPITTNFAIIVIGKAYGEVENLVNEVATYFTVFEDPIRKCLDFIRFEVNEIGPVDLLQEEKNYRAAQVSLVLSYNFGWELIDCSPVLESYDLKGCKDD